MGVCFERWCEGMLTEKEIRESLKKDPYWEPAENSTMEEWELFDKIYDEMDAKGELKFKDDDLGDFGNLGDGDEDLEDDIDDLI